MVTAQLRTWWALGGECVTVCLTLATTGFKHLTISHFQDANTAGQHFWGWSTYDLAKSMDHLCNVLIGS